MPTIVCRICDLAGLAAVLAGGKTMRVIVLLKAMKDTEAGIMPTTNSSMP